MFIMGDHGLRMTKFRQTEIGAIEDNNPGLFVVLPEKMRKNEEVRRIMDENAKKMITHFDLYATFVNIARVSQDRFKPLGTP